MATTRNNGMLTAANSAAIRNFKDRVARTIHRTCVGTINDVMAVGLQKLISEAGFNDYTGKMINSYQAAAISAGGIESRLATNFAKVDQFGSAANARKGNYQRVSAKIPVLRTSFGMPETEISHRTAIGTNKKGQEFRGFPMRVRRDGGESPEVRYMSKITTNKRYAKDMYDEGSKEIRYSKGFGHDYTLLKGIAPPFSHGYWIVFSNGHPLANWVHRQHEFHERGVQHKVFPDGGLDVNMFAIANKHMKTAIARAKRR